MTSFYDLDAVDALAQRLRVDPHALRKLRSLTLKRSLPFDEALSRLSDDAFPPELRRLRHSFLHDVQEFPSKIDGATKLVSRTDAGFLIESVVLRPATGRVALCVSSQVGCAAACRFCATGHMGVARDLASTEILDQVALVNGRIAAEGRRVRNIVFMGMGEPMHNEAAVQQALDVLQSPRGFGHPPTRILVSTVGVPEPLLRTASRFPLTNYAISLHSAVQEVRERIIPLARRYSLDELRGAIARLNRLQREKTSVMIEYLMLDGLNDSHEDALTLVEWLGGLRVHVNLIPYNPVEAAPDLASSPRQVIERFGAVLRSAGYPTTIRYSLGRDIDAACGQLVQSENREIARSLAQAASSASTS